MCGRLPEFGLDGLADHAACIENCTNSATVKSRPLNFGRIVSNSAYMG